MRARSRKRWTRTRRPYSAVETPLLGREAVKRFVKGVFQRGNFRHQDGGSDGSSRRPILLAGSHVSAAGSIIFFLNSKKINVSLTCLMQSMRIRRAIPL